jgi:cation diffusion facilitator CzcD-associated flavoprotein CzcO
MTGVLLIGAGPAALACALALCCHGGGDDLTVLDPSGRWLAAWHDRFRRQDIPHLRSPAVHHPHPDPFALLAAGGPDELVPSGTTKLPTTRRFARFVDQQIDDAGLAQVVRPAAAVALELGTDGRAHVRDDTGHVHRPDRVVVATNRRRPVIPTGLRSVVGDARLRLPDQVDVTKITAHTRIVVVGGGLSAGHLALGAAQRGAAVTLLTRRRLTVRRFDVHPSWLGPRKLGPFLADPDPQRRRAAIDRARGGGTIPHRIRRQLERCVADGRLQLRERVQVMTASDRRSALRLMLSDGGVVTADEVWLATGGHLDVRDDPLCAPLLRARPIAMADGLPDLAPDLSWAGTNVHLSGFATALRLGPTAGNLVGHRRAALRITASWRGQDPDRAERTTTGAGACPALAAPAPAVGRAR